MDLISHRDFTTLHPVLDPICDERPERLQVLQQRFRGFATGEAATREDIERVHTAEYVDRIAALQGSGWLDPDTYADATTFEASLLAAGCTIEAVRDHIDTVLRPLTAAHEIRSDTRLWDEAFSEAHLPTPDDPPLWYVEYGDDGAAADGTFPTLRLVPDRTATRIASCGQPPMQASTSRRGSIRAWTSMNSR